MLGAAGSVGYYYSVYLPSRDAQIDHESKLQAARAEYARQADQARQAAERREAEARATAERQEAEEKKTAEREAIQRRYRTCMRNAEVNYSTSWEDACKRISDQAAKGHRECISKGIAKSTCDLIYPSRERNPDCSLPRTVGNDITEVLEKSRTRCLDESRAGLQ